MTGGDQLFARYAYPPNQLGYCGPADSGDLFEVAVGVRGQARDACRFDGAWPYLELIARATGAGDPLDPAVVEAYWVGNALLEAVDPASLAETVGRSFAHQAGVDWDCLHPSHPTPVAAHHSFHVFAVYPWMRLLRQGRIQPALTVLDRCRIRWGQVRACRGDLVDVACQSLAWDGERLALGRTRIETFRGAADGRAISSSLATGSWVALHWDWVCDRLEPGQLEALWRFTARQLEVTNRVSAGLGHRTPVPAPDPAPEPAS